MLLVYIPQTALCNTVLDNPLSQSATDVVEQVMQYLSSDVLR